jgi:hypothetical protein
VHQLNPTKNESTHHDLAEFGIGLHQGHQLLTIHLDRLTRLGDTHSKESPSAGEHVDLARELTRAVDGDHGLSPAQWVHNFDLAGDNHKARDGAVSLFYEHLATLHQTHVPVRFHATNLGRRQFGKDLLST